MSSSIIASPTPFYPFLCRTLPVGRVDFTCDQIVENILSATEQVASKVESENLQSVHLKLPDSIALPILNCLPPGPTVIEVTSEPSKRRRMEEDTELSIDASGEIEEDLPVKKKMKKTKVTKLSTKRVRGSLVVKKLPTKRRKQKR